MSRVDSIRAEVQRLMRSTPFHPFALLMENGDRILVEHPENIAFDPAKWLFGVRAFRCDFWPTFSDEHVWCDYHYRAGGPGTADELIKLQ